MPANRIVIVAVGDDDHNDDENKELSFISLSHALEKTIRRRLKMVS